VTDLMNPGRDEIGRAHV